ncbi:hypothetical protein Plhal304r1_c004g0014261 [Plasmopara halstedii]
MFKIQSLFDNWIQPFFPNFAQTYPMIFDRLSVIKMYSSVSLQFSMSSQTRQLVSEAVYRVSHYKTHFGMHPVVSSTLLAWSIVLYPIRHLFVVALFCSGFFCPFLFYPCLLLRAYSFFKSIFG